MFPKVWPQSMLANYVSSEDNPGGSCGHPRLKENDLPEGSLLSEGDYRTVCSFGFLEDTLMSDASWPCYGQQMDGFGDFSHQTSFTESEKSRCTLSGTNYTHHNVFGNVYDCISGHSPTQKTRSRTFRSDGRISSGVSSSYQVVPHWRRAVYGIVCEYRRVPADTKNVPMMNENPYYGETRFQNKRQLLSNNSLDVPAKLFRADTDLAFPIKRFPPLDYDTPQYDYGLRRSSVLDDRGAGSGQGYTWMNSYPGQGIAGNRDKSFDSDVLSSYGSRDGQNFYSQSQGIQGGPVQSHASARDATWGFSQTRGQSFSRGRPLNSRPFTRGRGYYPRLSSRGSRPMRLVVGRKVLTESSKTEAGAGKSEKAGAWGGGAVKADMSKRATGSEGSANSEIANDKPNEQTNGQVDSDRSTADLLRDLVTKLKVWGDKENCIQTLETCITASRLPLKTKYEVEEEVSEMTSSPLYKGTLHLNELLLTRGTSAAKRQLKHQVYEKAVKALRTGEVDNLLADKKSENTATSQPQPLLKTEDLSSKIQKLMDKVKSSTEVDKQNVLFLDMAFIESRCGLRHKYQVEPITTEKGFHMYTRVRLYVEEKPFTSAIGVGKKEAKLHACQKALDTLRNKTVEQIMAEHVNPPESADGPGETGEQCEKERIGLYLPKEEDKVELLDTLIAKLCTESETRTKKSNTGKDCASGESGGDQKQGSSKQSTAKDDASRNPSTDETQEEGVTSGQGGKSEELTGGQEKMPNVRQVMTEVTGNNMVMTIDKICLQLKLKLMAVYRKVSEGSDCHVTCDVYICDRFIGQGRGPSRKLAQTCAYREAAQVLRGTTGEAILNMLPAACEDDLKAPDILDVVYKGFSRVYESNVLRMKRLKQPPEEKRRVSEMVILEHEDWATDRLKHAHCILSQSAAHCGQLLEWVTEPEGPVFKCSMKLQGQELSNCLGKTRRVACTMASAKVLFSLYESQPVIACSRADYSKVWVTREQLTTFANSLTEDDIKATTTSELLDGAGLQVSKRMVAAMTRHLSEFFQRPTLAEYVMGPDWAADERRCVRQMAFARGLRVNSDSVCEEQVMVISHKHDLLQMVELLEAQTTKSEGRYRLLPAEEKPSLNDIAGEIAANASMMRELQGQGDNEELPGLESFLPADAKVEENGKGGAPAVTKAATTATTQSQRLSPLGGKSQATLPARRPAFSLSGRSLASAQRTSTPGRDWKKPRLSPRASVLSSRGSPAAGRGVGSPFRRRLSSRSPVLNRPAQQQSESSWNGTPSGLSPVQPAQGWTRPCVTPPHAQPGPGLRAPAPTPKFSTPSGHDLSSSFASPASWDDYRSKCPSEPSSAVLYNDSWASDASLDTSRQALWNMPNPDSNSMGRGQNRWPEATDSRVWPGQTEYSAPARLYPGYETDASASGGYYYDQQGQEYQGQEYQGQGKDGGLFRQKFSGQNGYSCNSTVTHPWHAW
ncbi:uncharacterized protein LOC101845633 isoform X2 [Aplysia californica]|uniref:Uncharacterized protein LOC101845633 isoform X2 n=1 Tax=Aplysia californica TaxID=6500 RepID=A0ABM1VX50_APLCA|nr:uncharacterized protein LOC101845633 isoform X2 [Aplysia californica]